MDNSLQNHFYSSINKSNYRKYGDTPSNYDLSSVTFKFGEKFSIGETVLVPRSRGGFVYGKISKQLKKKSCFFDSSISHSYIEWKVEYPNIQGRLMFKTQPSFLLGKLKDKNDEKLSKLSNNQERKIGSYGSARDLNNITLTNFNKFSIGEIVLVGRSSGGFTYGEILSSINVICILPLHKIERHDVPGWRVALDSKKSMKKELVSSFIGKLPLCGAQLERPIIGITNNNGKQQEDIKKKEKSSKNINKRFNDISDSLTPAKSIETISLSNNNEEINTNFSDSSDNYEDNEGNEDIEDKEEEEEEESSEEIFYRPPRSIIADEDDSEDSDEEIFIKPINQDKKEEINSKNEQNDKSSSLNGIIDISSIDICTPVTNHSSKQKKKCLVVIDAPNVAMKHGNKVFSTKGISICVDYWKQRGHEVVAFLPEHYVSSKAHVGTVTLDQYFPKVDNMKLIKQLEKQGIMFYTPPQDYDDSYCIQYARTNNGVIVSNDLYRDHIEKTIEKERGRTRHWIRTHVISYTFVKDQFLPNPDFKFPAHCKS